MKLLDTLNGKWSGHGETIDAESKEVIDHLQIRIEINLISETEAAGKKEIRSLMDKSEPFKTEFRIEVLSEEEFTYDPSWSDKPLNFMYMESPVSFQGNYIKDGLRVLDNNFIMDDQWQINLEYESDEIHQIVEIALDKDS